MRLEPAVLTTTREVIEWGNFAALREFGYGTKRHSITSSARVCSGGGTSMPNALRS